MACKQETREIKGKQVFVRQWPAAKALEMQIKVLETFGDDCLSFAMGDWTFANLMYVLQHSPRDAVLSVVKECTFAARVDGVEISNVNFDIELSGELMFIYDLFSFVLEVNFKDFFVEGLARMDALKK